jgi:hypothetical protein
MLVAERIGYAEYVVRCFEKPDTKAIQDLECAWGMSWVEMMYERGLAARRSGIPDKTEIAEIMSRKAVRDGRAAAAGNDK